MRRQPAGDQIKAVIVEGQRFSIGRFCGEVAQASFLGQPGGFGQHFGGDVAGDDLGNVGGEGQRRVTGAGGLV